MGAAGVQPQADKAAPVFSSENPVQRARFPAVGPYLAAHGRAFRFADRQVDQAFRFRRRAFNHRQVFPHKISAVQKPLQKVLGVGGFRHKHQPARALVQPVDGTVNKGFRATKISVYRVFKRQALLADG